MRPADDDASGADNSDDILSGEDVILSSDTLLDALRTRIGGVAHKEAANSDDKYKVTDHHANSSAAVRLSQEAWGETSTPKRPNQPEFSAPAALSEALKAARSPQKQENATEPVSRQTERQPGVSATRAATSEDVRVWLSGLKTRRNKTGRLAANAQQFAAVNEVAHRVMRELEEEVNDDDADAEEPLRKLVHGGPGTGKTHVIKLIKELLGNVHGWQQGLQFQVVAFQAVVAHLIGGDTIHHALGIPVFTDGR